jgi:N-hydroxyarylamine O-acetyltransferase
MIESLSPAQLDAYFGRIRYTGPRKADLATLTALHRAHVLAVPFENLDVQLGRPPSLDPDAIFSKLVTARRGGWCYEQNGLFARALAALAFPVTRMSGGVMRALRGEASMGSHLCLKVQADGADWLADVGFGSSQLEPVPLAEHAWDQVPMAGQVWRTDDGLWQFAIEQGPMPLSYDFVDAPADESLLGALCNWQGRDPESIFVQNLVVQRRLPEGHIMLRGKVLTETGHGGQRVRELGSGAELEAVLRDTFALDVPEAAGLWPEIEARHSLLFPLT